MSVFATIAREIHDARATGYRRIVHIRVTADAIPGSPVAVSVTPERARVLGRLLMIGDEHDLISGVVADPASTETMLELLLHPQDFDDVLREADPSSPYTIALHDGEPDRIFGVPVTRT